MRGDSYSYFWIRFESCLEGFKNVGLKNDVLNELSSEPVSQPAADSQGDST